MATVVDIVDEAADVVDSEEEASAAMASQDVDEGVDTGAAAIPKLLSSKYPYRRGTAPLHTEEPLRCIKIASRTDFFRTWEKSDMSICFPAFERAATTIGHTRVLS